jgi:hypothetical protein
MLERIVKTSLLSLLGLAALSFAIGIMKLYVDFWMWLSSGDTWGVLAALSLIGFVGIFVALWTMPRR